MIMRVTWGKIRPGKWDKFEKLWSDLAKETKDTPGLLGRWLLLDNDAKDAGYSLTLWDSSKDAENYSKPRDAYKDMQDCFVGQFITTTCEVRASELSGLLKRMG